MKDTKEVAQVLCDNMPSELKDAVYRYLWLDYVKEDVRSIADGTPDMFESFTDECYESIIESAARRYVYDGDYDCNLDYWTNIQNVLNEQLKLDGIKAA